MLAPIELPVLSRVEDWSIVGDAEPVADGRLVLSDAMPGGWSQSVYVDGVKRLWIVSRESRAHFPDGMPTPSTRVFTTTVSIPAGYVLGGRIQLVDTPERLPPA